MDHGAAGGPGPVEIRHPALGLKWPQERIGQELAPVADARDFDGVVDVRAALSFVDAYVLIVEWGRTSIDTVERALHSARAVYDKVAGVVLNKVDFNSLGRFDGEPGKYYYKNKLYARYGYVEH